MVSTTKKFGLAEFLAQTYCNTWLNPTSQGWIVAWDQGTMLYIMKKFEGYMYLFQDMSADSRQELVSALDRFRSGVAEHEDAEQLQTMLEMQGVDLDVLQKKLQR